MHAIPGWLSAIGIVFTLAAVLGAAVAVFRTSLNEAKLKDANRTIDSLRGEIADYMRRDHEKDKIIAGLQVSRDECQRRITVLEELLTHRVDDAEIRLGIAQLKQTVDDELRTSMLRIETLLGGGVNAGNRKP